MAGRSFLRGGSLIARQQAHAIECFVGVLLCSTPGRIDEVRGIDLIARPARLAADGRGGVSVIAWAATMINGPAVERVSQGLRLASGYFSARCQPLVADDDDDPGVLGHRRSFVRRIRSPSPDCPSLIALVPASVGSGQHAVRFSMSCITTARDWRGLHLGC